MSHPETERAVGQSDEESRSRRVAPGTFGQDRFGRALGAVLAAAVALHALAALLRVAAQLPVHDETLFPESAVVARALDAAQARSPYQDWRHWPHAFAPYGPLTYYPAGWLARVGHWTANPWKLLLIGRMQSLAALGGCALLMVLILHRARLDRRWAAMGGASLFLWDAPLVFGGTFRPDMPQVFFSLAALAVALGGSANRRRAAAALLLLSISMWFKASSWGCALALGYWLAATGSRRILGIAVASFATVNGLLAVLLDRAVGGTLCLNVVHSLDNGWERANLARVYMEMGFGPGEPARALALLAICLLGLAGSVAALARSDGDNRERTLAVATLAAFAVSNVLDLKMGAWVNYFFEAYALLTAMAAIWLRRLWAGEFRIPRAATRPLICLSGAVILFLSLCGMVSWPNDIGALRARWRPSALAERVKGFDGPILSPQAPSLLLERPALPSLVDFAQYGILLRRGKISDVELLARVNRREFTAVVLMHGDAFKRDFRAPWFPRDFIPALQANYQIQEQFGEFMVLVPRR